MRNEVPFPTLFPTLFPTFAGDSWRHIDKRFDREKEQLTSMWTLLIARTDLPSESKPVRRIEMRIELCISGDAAAIATYHQREVAQTIENTKRAVEAARRAYRDTRAAADILAKIRFDVQTVGPSETIVTQQFGDRFDLTAHCIHRLHRIQCSIAGATGASAAELQSEWQGIKRRACALLDLCEEGRDMDKEMEAVKKAVDAQGVRR